MPKVLVLPSGVSGINTLGAQSAITGPVTLTASPILPSSATPRLDPNNGSQLGISVGIVTRISLPPQPPQPTATRAQVISTRSRPDVLDEPVTTFTPRPIDIVLPAYTPVAALPWWTWNQPSEAGDGVTDDGSDTFEDVEDSEDDEDGWEWEWEYDGDEAKNENENGLEDKDHSGYAHGNNYKHGDGNEGLKSYEVGIKIEQADLGDADDCDCACDWWWTDEGDNEGEGIDWEWVTDDPIFFEKDGVCKLQEKEAIAASAIIQPHDEDNRKESSGTDENQKPSPTSQVSISGWPLTTPTHHDGNHASEHEQPSWRDGIPNAWWRSNEASPSTSWSDGAMFHA